MSCLERLPQLKQCCCVTDLKTAAAIIAVLGIVTNPATTWAVVRHSYVVGMSCFVSTSVSHPDILDITLNKIVHFGFGRNAGLGPSCVLMPDTNSTPVVAAPMKYKQDRDHLTGGVYVVGWCVLVTDCLFVFVSIVWLIMMFYSTDSVASLIFMIVGVVVLLLSFVYSILYTAACTSTGGSFPLFEFFFSFFDVIVWTYFLLVVNSYRCSLQ